MMRGNPIKPQRRTWSVELIINYLRCGLLPSNLYDLPYRVVKEFFYLLEEYPRLQSMIEDSDEAMKKAEANHARSG